MHKNNKLYKYLANSRKKKNYDFKIKNEIDYCIYKSFKGNDNKLNNYVNNNYLWNVKGKKFISDNVLIVKNLNEILNNIDKENFIVLLNKDSSKYFNSIYPKFLNKKKLFYFENIKNGKNLREVIKLVRKNNYKILCIGGGKVIDISKFISFKSKKLLISIPTILATHVYASPKIHSLHQIKQLGYELTIDGKASNLSIIDIRLINKQFLINKRFILSGMGDLMAFYNAKLDWKLSKKFNDKKNLFTLDAIKKVENILESIRVEKPLKNWISKYIFAQVLLCNITHWKGSAPASGAEHFFANLYEEKYKNNILHGELVALGTLIFRYFRGENYSKIFFLIKKFKINRFLKKPNITKNKLVNILERAKNEGKRKKRFSILDLIKVSKSDWKKIIDQLNEKKLIGI